MAAPEARAKARPGQADNARPAAAAPAAGSTPVAGSNPAPVAGSNPAPVGAPARPGAAVATLTHRRLLLTIDDTPCPFACTYCFATFSQYGREVRLADLERDPALADGADVLYPACDVDLFARPDALAVLERVVRFGRTISVSTKAHISPARARALAGIHRRLRRHGAILKVGVSFSTKHQVPAIEPATPSYHSRLRGLAHLAAAGLPAVAVLRPLLADVADSEYEEILRDVRGYARAVLFGQEWLDLDLSRRRPLVGPVSDSFAVATRHRQVNWVDGSPEWPERIVHNRIERLRTVSSRLGLRAFDSDLELVDHLR